MKFSKYTTISELSHSKFKRCTGVSKFVFEIMVLIVREYDIKHKKKAGRTSNLATEDQLLLLLEYYREYRTLFHLGFSYGLAESNVYRTIVKLENILITSGYFRLDGKKVLTSAEKIKEILIDATELPAQRPKKKVRNRLKIKRSSKQKRKYSGKKKAHTHKIQVVENADTKQIICLHFATGSCHDFNLYKKSKLRVHPDIKQKVDKGYVGILKLHRNVDIPLKNTKLHKLTKEQKKNNRLLAKQRVPIEHTNRRLKIFGILQQKYRSHAKLGLRATLIAAFCNADLYSNAA